MSSNKNSSSGMSSQPGGSAESPPGEGSGRNPGWIVALVVGCILAVPAFVMLLSGGVLTGAYASQRDDGFFNVTLDELRSSSAAITAEQIDLTTEPGTPRWVLDALETDVRLRVTGTDGDKPIFVGVASEQDLDRYLAGVAHDEIREVDNDLTAVFRGRSGAETVSPPGDQDFWEVSATGSGTQELEWEATSGRWAVALLNANGSPNVAADVNVGIRSAAFLPVAISLLVAGAVLSAIAVALIVLGGKALGAEASTAGSSEPVLHPTVSSAPYPVAPAPYPVALQARLDPQLSNWQWLVKWFLSIPHLIVLALLWVAFGLLTFVAGVTILVTGRYPRAIFDFNVGVLRWSWRVSYYAFSGGLGTDQYPPFSLGSEPSYPATLDVEYPEQLSRWLVLIKWWLLALPHYFIVAIIAGAGFQWDSDVNWGTNGGLVGILTLVAAVILLFSRSYPKQLFDLIIGMNRWVYRVAAYASLMTDVYPPFRLDQGGSEPNAVQDYEPPSRPSGAASEVADELAGEVRQPAPTP